MLKLNYFQEKCVALWTTKLMFCAISHNCLARSFTPPVNRGGGVEEQFRTKTKSNIPKKFLVWQALCSCGDRSSNFVTSGTINSEIYVKECLRKRLLPFINKHRGSAFFWPDLASCHYSKMALDWYKDNNINFVPKEANPSNCPELRLSKGTGL